jgi:hypothetical protein
MGKNTRSSFLKWGIHGIYQRGGPFYTGLAKHKKLGGGENGFRLGAWFVFSHLPIQRVQQVGPAQPWGERQPAFPLPLVPQLRVQPE